VRRTSAVGLVALAATLVFSPLALASPTEPIGHAGRWITDATGRVVILHGVNVVPSGFETPPETPGQAGFGRDDAAFIASQGFDAVRLGMFYAGVESQPGSYEGSYLDQYQEIQATLAEAGVFTLLDMHQDQYTGRFAGRGLPDWAALDEGLPNTQQGFPGGYFSNPALNRSYDNFWGNADAGDGEGLLDHYGEGWRRIASRFADAPRLLGYDIFNEPWPGTAWPACANPAGCPPGGFDQTALTAFSTRTIQAIRQVDPVHLAFYEPNLQFDVGAATGHGTVGDSNAGFSFHDYCIGGAPGLPKIPDPLQLCAIGEQLVFDNAEAHSRSTGAALLMTEFGDIDDPGTIERVANAADRNMVGWTYWSYFRSAGGQIIRDPSLPPTEPGNLREGVLDVIVRPHPQTISGTPRRYGFRLEGREFELEFSPRRADDRGRFATGSESEIAVPERQYPHGYAVEVEGAEVTSAPGAPVLTLASCPNADQVTVRIALSGGPSRSCAQQRRQKGACLFTQRGTSGNDRLEGSKRGDRLLGGRGDDRLLGRRGRDCLSGNRGRDRLTGGRAHDVLRGGRGADRLDAARGGADVVRCGAGRDVVHADRRDRLRGCGPRADR
jgi:endoglycosylceramidase